MELLKKEEFTEVKIEIVEFDTEDVITTSGFGGGNQDIDLPEVRF